MNLNLRSPLPGKPDTPRSPLMDLLFIESAYRGGPRPHQRRPLRSLITEFLDTRPEARGVLAAYRSDLEPFEMDLLEPERTFAELEPTPEQAAVLTSRHEDEDERSLYSGDRVPFSGILARTAKLRDQLVDGAWR